MNQGAIVKHLSGRQNTAADFNSRNAAPCTNPEVCAICKWVSDKETQVVRRLSTKNADSVLAGKDPAPFRSKGYWEKRQKEDPILNKVARCLKKGIKPALTKANRWPEARRYLLPDNKVYLKGGVLMSPSVEPFSDTERFVVPKSAGMSVVSIFHQQFDCRKHAPLKALLRRNFLILNLDDVIS